MTGVSAAVRDLLIGVDVGTTGTKAMAVDEAGRIHATAYASYPLSRPRPLVVEQDPHDWWNAVVTTIRECLRDVAPERVRAIAVSAQGGSLVAVDAANRPLAAARSWLDRRAADGVEALRERFGADEFFRHTGWRLYGAYNCVQLIEMRRSEPDLFASASAFLGTGEYVNARLTGVRAADLNGAGITQLLDVAAGTWSVATLDFLGIDAGRLAPLVRSGEPIGTLCGEAAEALGLPEDVVVAAGGHDQYCAALGAGVTSPGDVLLSTGTAWVVLGITGDAFADPSQNFGFGRHVVPGTWGEFGSFRNGGVCLDWARQLLGREPDSYTAVNELAAGVAAGAEGLRFFPHFDGTNIPTWVDEAKGTLLGLEMRHGRGEVYRGVMEGVAFEARRVLESYASFGPTVSTVTLLGGAARSPVWADIISDVLGGGVEIADVPDSACIGAAALAGAGSGLWRDPGEASRALVPTARPVPGSGNAELYDGLYREYCDASTALLNLYRSEKNA